MILAGSPLLVTEKPGWVETEGAPPLLLLEPCSYAHSECMSYPQMQLQRVGCSDTKDNDQVCQQVASNECNQENTDRMASLIRREPSVMRGESLIQQRHRCLGHHSKQLLFSSLNEKAL